MTTPTPDPAHSSGTAPAPSPTPTPGQGTDPRRGTAGRVLFAVGLGLGILLVAWAALLLVDRAVSSTGTTREDYDASADLGLVADGDVEVRTDDTTTGIEVEVVAHSGLVAPRYAVEQVGDRLVLTHECPSWAWFSWVCSGELRAVVPTGTAVDVETSNGDVAASGLDGGAELRSGNGDVAAQAMGGDVLATSSNGDLVLTDLGGDVEVRTSNGSVDVSRVEGRVSARSSNGDVAVSDVGAGVFARTSNGSIDVSTAGGDVEAQSSNGSVEVAGAAGDVLARTSNGSATVVGDGEPVNLIIDTSNGSETIEGPTDPQAQRTVEVRSSNGDVAYLAP